MSTFKLKSPFAPAGDQVNAIKQLHQARPEKGRNARSTLLGVTGSGKTYTIAQVIAQQSKPVLILSPNKTLAAQLYEEFSQFFPENKVCYFVSYYDYYQPESYMPASDVYIAKETKINDEIERLRVEATASIVNRKDTIVIASVSCIYSLGNPHDYRSLTFGLKKNEKIFRAQLIKKLQFIQYIRNDVDKKSGTFQVLGPTIEVQLPYMKEKLRIELFGDVIESLQWVDRNNNTVLRDLDDVLIFPAKHFVTTEEKKEKALVSIEKELENFLPKMKNPLYQERLRARVTHDLEMIEERGFCSGIENYSRHFDGRLPGQAPHCLFDFFEDFLLVIDESHIAVPQLRGMYAGDRARKGNLIDYGFRLPSARDNRPLKFEEIERHFNDVIFVSATPGDYELATSDAVVEQIIRPTGLVDPEIEIHGRKGQIDHLLEQITQTTEKGFRSLVTVMTKKMAEELAKFLEDKGVKVCYLHCDLKTPQRTELLHKLRSGVFDCLVGVNLLREGLDLPEVALMAVMDADVESFLRDKRSLIQIIGRVARNSQSRVLFYADRITKSMRAAMDETSRRRELQIAYNEKHNITPQSVTRDVSKSIAPGAKKEKVSTKRTKKLRAQKASVNIPEAREKRLKELEKQMQRAAAQLDFETAIALRQEYMELKKEGDDYCSLTRNPSRRS